MADASCCHHNILYLPYQYHHILYKLPTKSALSAIIPNYSERFNRRDFDSAFANYNEAVRLNETIAEHSETLMFSPYDSTAFIRKDKEAKEELENLRVKREKFGG